MAIDFEVISDTFEDGFENAKKFVKKNKVFPFLLLGVGVFALYSNYKKTSTSNNKVAYVPTYYDGYPISEYESVLGGGGSSSISDYPESIDKESYYESIVEQIEAENEMKISNIVSSYENQLLSLTESMSYLEEQNKIEKVKKDMKNNSFLWGLTTDENERNSLHEQNKQLGYSIGASFDDATGTWWLNGERLFFTENELSGISTPIVSLDNNIYKNNNSNSTGDSVTVSYNKDVDYMGKIIETINTGGSVSDVNLYDSQRDAKIKGENITNTYYDANTDYQALINKATSMGANQSVIDSLNEMRNAKIEGEKKKSSSGSTGSKSSSSSKSSSGSKTTTTNKSTSLNDWLLYN